jgi:hypothetical protein
MPEGIPSPGAPAGPGGFAYAPPPVPVDISKEKALSIVNSNPKQAANVVKEWLQE